MFIEKTHMDYSTMHPESLMMSHGYKPSLSEGAIKSPIFPNWESQYPFPCTVKISFPIYKGEKIRFQQSESIPVN